MSTTTGLEYANELIQLGTIAGGGAHPLTYAVMQYVLAMQQDNRLKGGLAEVGVLLGHTFGLLAANSGPGETVVGIDVNRQQLETARAKVQERLAATHPNLALALVVGSSMSLGVKRGLEKSVDDTGLRFAHIDGEHSHDAVLNDAHMLAPLMAPWGVICFDDVFNLPCACVTEAVFDFARQSEWRMFLMAPNKAFLCKARYLPFYVDRSETLLPFLESKFSFQAGIARSTHSPRHGYLSVFPTEKPYFQVVNRGFGDRAEFVAWDRRHHPEGDMFG